MKNIFWNKAIGLGIICFYLLFIASIATSVFTTQFTDEPQYFAFSIKTALIPTLFGIIGVLLGGLVIKRKIKVDLGIALSLLNFSLFVFLIYIS
ncbi:MAG TPA: hypothetical protein EYO35_05550 [Flavobacteriaceae bacterium]|nr:hypothetical protein [Flavobacteriaceae bacterium]